MQVNSRHGLLAQAKEDYVEEGDAVEKVEWRSERRPFWKWI